METSNLNLHAMKIYGNVGTDCTFFQTAYYTVRAKIRVTFFKRYLILRIPFSELLYSNPNE